MSLGTFPVGAVTVSGQQITTDAWLKREEVINRRVADITQKKFIAQDIFTISGINAPAVVTEIPNAVDNDLFTTTDAQRVEPLTRFPRAKATRGTLTTFTPEKWGHEYEVSQEAIDDNDVSVQQRAPQQLANTLVRKLNIRAIETLEAAATAYSRTQAAAATWDAINALTADNKTNASSPLNVLALADEKVEEEERGWEDTFDTLLLHTNQKRALRIALGKDWRSYFAEEGITKIVSSPRVTAGTAYYLASGQVGAMRFNQPLSTRVYEKPEVDGRIIQSKCRFIPYVNEPYAFLKLTGLE